MFGYGYRIIFGEKLYAEIVIESIIFLCAYVTLTIRLIELNTYGLGTTLLEMGTGSDGSPNQLC